MSVDPLLCAHCGADKKQFGTSVDLEIFYEDFKYELEPSFCSWEHAVAWFNGPRPDFSTWEDDRRTLGDRVFSAVISLVMLGLIVLAVVGFFSLV